MMHVQKGERAKDREGLEDALAIFLQLGAQPYMEQTEQSLGALDRD